MDNHRPYLPEPLRPELDEAVRRAWEQLRQLAGEDGQARASSLQALVRLVGMPRATLYRRLRVLRDQGYLDWQVEPGSEVVVTFLQTPGLPLQASGVNRTGRRRSQPRGFSRRKSDRESQECETESHKTMGESQKCDVKSQESAGESQESAGESQESAGESQEYTGESQEYAGEYQEYVGESQKYTGESQEQAGESQENAVESQENGGESQKSGSESQKTALLSLNTLNIKRIDSEELREGGVSFPAAEIDPVRIYRRVMQRSPNKEQRQAIISQVTDARTWQETIEHWCMHGWNPVNLVGMLEMYQRGGVAGCISCSKDALASTRPPSPTDITSELARAPIKASLLTASAPYSASTTTKTSKPTARTTELDLTLWQPLPSFKPASPATLPACLRRYQEIDGFFMLDTEELERRGLDVSALRLELHDLLEHLDPLERLLGRLLLAYPYALKTPVVEPGNWQIFRQELEGIPLRLLEDAIQAYIRASTWFPRVSELREMAAKMANVAGSPTGFESLPHVSDIDELDQRLVKLEEAYYLAGRLNKAKWRRLAADLEAAGRPSGAARARERYAVYLSHG